MRKAYYQKQYKDYWVSHMGCNYCEVVTIPDYIPQEQYEKYLASIVKKNDCCFKNISLSKVFVERDEAFNKGYL